MAGEDRVRDGKPKPNSWMELDDDPGDVAMYCKYRNETKHCTMQHPVQNNAMGTKQKHSLTS